MKVNLLPAQPGFARRVYDRAKAIAPKIGRAALIFLPALFGMPIAMTIEIRPLISLKIMSALKSRAQAAIAHLKPAVASLTDREKALRRRTDAALLELEQQVLKFRRAIEGDKDHADLMLMLIKHHETSYLAAADELFKFINNHQLPLKEKLLLRAEAELRWIEIGENLINREGGKEAADVHAQTFKARLTREIGLKTLELQDLEKQLAQMDEALKFTRAQIDQACDAEQIVSGQMSLSDILDLLELKLGWLRIQLSTLDFRRGRVMPLREQILALETLLFSLFKSDSAGSVEDTN